MQTVLATSISGALLVIGVIICAFISIKLYYFGGRFSPNECMFMAISIFIFIMLYALGMWNRSVDIAEARKSYTYYIDGIETPLEEINLKQYDVTYDDNNNVAHVYKIRTAK